MPFKKEGSSYRSPSGRKFTAAQVKLYYAHDGFPDKHKHVRTALKKQVHRGR
mgnify:CR=1 FL=1